MPATMTITLKSGRTLDFEMEPGTEKLTSDKICEDAWEGLVDLFSCPVIRLHARIIFTREIETVTFTSPAG